MISTKQKETYNIAISITDKLTQVSEFGTTEIGKSIHLLIKTFEFAGQKMHIPILRSLADKLVKQNDTIGNKNYSLYQGRMEEVYTLVQVSKVINEPKYLDKALEIAKGCNTEFLYSPECTNGLYKGRAGTLLTLLHLFDATQQEWILGYIKTYTERILQETIITNKGAYWDHSAQNIKGLCDFAEGTAGISFVFRELGFYFKTDAFNIVVDWATEYENAQWNTELQNWGNHKKKITSKEELFYYIDAYKRNDQKEFLSNYTDFSWKHGSSGIILSAQRSSNSQQLSNITTFAEKIVTENIVYENDEQFFGEIRALFYAGNKLQSNVYKEKARSFLLDQMKNCKDEVELGLLCFELCSDTLNSSLYFPILENSNYEENTLNLDSKQVKNFLLRGTFPKSVEYLENIATTEFETFLGKGKSVSIFTDLLYSKYHAVPSIEDISLQMEVLLEKAQFEMFTPKRNNILQWIQKIVMQQRFSEIYAEFEEVVINKRLHLNNDDMKMVKVSNMEDLDLKNPNEHTLEAFINYGIDTFMLQMTDKGTIHRTSLQIVKLIYASFITGNTIQNVITELSEFIAGQNDQVIGGVQKTLFIDDDDFEVGFKKALTRITIDMAYNGILKPVDGKLWL